MKIVDDDPIMPRMIEHTVEEIWDDDQLVQHYNFLDYHFDANGAYMRARVYLDDMSVATMFGPFIERGSITATRAPEMQEAVTAYLSRRYPMVETR